MTIDSHQHFWKFDPIRDAWIDNSMKVLRQDFLPEDLRPILAENGIDACIAVQADQSEEETHFLLQCAIQNDFIKGVVGWLDLQAENIEERLTHFSKDPLLKGLRHIVQAEKDNNFVLNPAFQDGISKLEAFGLSYDILVYPQQLPASIELVRNFPNQIFILDHIAKPSISESMDRNWLENITRLAENENVFCKLSGMVTETKDFKWREKDIQIFIKEVVQAFGIDRVMFGSDWPVCLLAAEYQQVTKIIQNFFLDFSKEEIQKVMGGNAIKAYNL